MKFRASVLDEPLLEFGGGGREIDTRLGLMRHGPLEPERAHKVRLGIIGTSETIEGFARFLDRCQVGIEAKPSRQPNLFLPFPGLANENPFRCLFEVDPRARKPIPRSDITRIAGIKSRAAAIEEGVALFAAQAQAIAEAPGPPDVIVCALPFDLITSVIPDAGLNRAEEAEDDRATDTAAVPDFRDLLKARTIHLKRPLQVMWPTTWEDSGRTVRQLAKLANKSVQDPATRAWNLFGGLYYKAGNIPWRLPRDPAQFDTSYVGISFYRDLSGQRLLTSTAQMFDERGQGLILRGGQARTDKQDRRPYLSRTDAYDLLKRSLTAYGAHHFHSPARVIIYKTSPFRTEEAEGFEEALAEARVRLSDLVWISEDSEFRLYRDGAYPPLRGTYLELENNALLYCRGSVPYYRTYPGLYIPKPLLLQPHAGGESTLSELARETLALSKMNWNSTQFDGSSPITLRASRVVGRVLKHVSLGALEAAEYRHYI
jgi:hypothetical protein